MTASVLKQDLNAKMFEQCLLILTRTQYANFRGTNNRPSAEQAVKNKPKEDKYFSVIFHRFWPFICCLSVVLWLDKGDFPENVHTVCLC